MASKFSVVMVAAMMWSAPALARSEAHPVVTQGCEPDDAGAVADAGVLDDAGASDDAVLVDAGALVLDDAGADADAGDAGFRGYMDENVCCMGQVAPTGLHPNLVLVGALAVGVAVIARRRRR